jgi:hypothetical protein
VRDRVDDGVVRVVVHVAAVVLGALAGAVGSFLQPATIDVGPVPLPLGLLAGLALSLAVFVGAGLVTGSRVGALLAVLGWFVTVLVLALPRAEGDAVLEARPPAYVWLYGGMLMCALVVAIPYRSVAPRVRGWLESRWGGRLLPREGAASISDDSRSSADDDDRR